MANHKLNYGKTNDKKKWNYMTIHVQFKLVCSVNLILILLFL